MKEKRINYLQILYYTVAGVVVGILVGAIDAVFGRVLLAITDFRGQHVMVLVPFLGAAGVLILFLYQKFSPKAQKGMGLIFDTGFEENEKIPPALVPLIMVSTWLTHLFGGSAGRKVWRYRLVRRCLMQLADVWRKHLWEKRSACIMAEFF